MARKLRLPTLCAALPALPESQVLFGPRPLIAGEDAAAYDDLFARVTKAVAPADILEELWVRDVVDLFWDALRLRRLKAKLIVAATRGALEEVLAPQLATEPAPGVLKLVPGWAAAEQLALKWVARDRTAIRQVDALLAAAGLTMDDVMARALALRLHDVEQIDRMIMNAEIRRNAALRELDRHRAAAADVMRRAIDEVEDAEFEVVPPPVGEERSAA
jgi:hypothetical protein